MKTHREHSRTFGKGFAASHVAYSLLLAAALTLAWGCSSGDDGTPGSSEPKTSLGGATGTSTFEASDAPTWAVDMHSDQEKPQWQAPTTSLYMENMIVLLRLQDELVPYSTDDDLMAVFVGDECRALSNRSAHGEVVYFVLNIHGNTSSDPEDLAVCYYSGGLRQKFWRRGENGFLNELIIGTEKDFVLDLMEGTTKYNRQTVVTVEPKQVEGITIDDEADLVGVFVGGECRGVGRPNISFNVYHQEDEEQAQVRYYSKSKGGIYTLLQTLTLDAGVQTIDFIF